MAASSPKAHDLCQTFLNAVCRRSRDEHNALEHLAGFSPLSWGAEMSRDDRVHSASSAGNTARPAGSGNTQQCAPLFGGRERFNVKKKPLVGTLSPGSSWPRTARPWRSAEDTALPLLAKCPCHKPLAFRPAFHLYTHPHA